jgi:hypothetical protein
VGESGRKRSVHEFRNFAEKGLALIVLKRGLGVLSHKIGVRQLL